MSVSLACARPPDGALASARGAPWPAPAGPLLAQVQQQPAAAPPGAQVRSSSSSRLPACRLVAAQQHPPPASQAAQQHPLQAAQLHHAQAAARAAQAAQRHGAAAAQAAQAAQKLGSAALQHVAGPAAPRDPAAASDAQQVRQGLQAFVEVQRVVSQSRMLTPRRHSSQPEQPREAATPQPPDTAREAQAQPISVPVEVRAAQPQGLQHGTSEPSLRIERRRSSSSGASAAAPPPLLASAGRPALAAGRVPQERPASPLRPLTPITPMDLAAAAGQSCPHAAASPTPGGGEADDIADSMVLSADGASAYGLSAQTPAALPTSERAPALGGLGCTGSFGSQAAAVGWSPELLERAFAKQAELETEAWTARVRHTLGQALVDALCGDSLEWLQLAALQAQQAGVQADLLDSAHSEVARRRVLRDAEDALHAALASRGPEPEAALRSAVERAEAAAVGQELLSHARARLSQLEAAALKRRESARAEQRLQEQLRSGAGGGAALAVALQSALEAGAGWDALETAWAAKAAMEEQAWRAKKEMAGHRWSVNSARASTGSRGSAQTAAAAAGPLQDEASRLDTSCAAASRLDASCTAVSRLDASCVAGQASPSPVLPAELDASGRLPASPARASWARAPGATAAESPASCASSTDQPGTATLASPLCMDPRARAEIAALEHRPDRRPPLAAPSTLLWPSAAHPDAPAATGDPSEEAEPSAPLAAATPPLWPTSEAASSGGARGPPDAPSCEPSCGGGQATAAAEPSEQVGPPGGHALDAPSLALHLPAARRPPVAPEHGAVSGSPEASPACSPLPPARSPCTGRSPSARSLGHSPSARSALGRSGFLDASALLDASVVLEEPSAELAAAPSLPAVPEHRQPAQPPAQQPAQPQQRPCAQPRPQQPPQGDQHHQAPDQALPQPQPPQQAQLAQAEPRSAPADAPARPAESVRKSLPSYGLDAELKAKNDQKYAEKKGDEEDAARWIQEITGHQVVGDFVGALRSGQVLCELVNCIRPNTIRAINAPGKPFKERENICKFIQACRDLGVKEYGLFSTDDLYEEVNVLSVVKCIHNLGGAVQGSVPEFDGPSLGVADRSRTKGDFKRSLGIATVRGGLQCSMEKSHIDMTSGQIVRGLPGGGGGAR